MKIVFRVDSGSHMGVGHLMRCLTLAHALKNKNQLFFIVKNHIGFDSKLIPNEFKVFILNNGVQKVLTHSERLDYKNWLGESWENDLFETNKIIKTIGEIDLVIIDHYSLGIEYESGLLAKKILVIDDLMNRKHRCDLLLDQNITADEKEYSSLVDTLRTVLCLGPRFSLLRPEFKDAHTQIDPRKFDREIYNVLVFFGAADVNGDCLKLAKQLIKNKIVTYQFTFVLNSGHQDYLELEKLVKENGNMKLLSFIANFNEYMVATDLFIGAGGTTTWERACLGVATALFSVADNQTKICEELGKRGICYYIGKSFEMNDELWKDFLQRILPDKALWRKLRSNSYQLVDGLGISRLINAIEKLTNDND